MSSLFLSVIFVLSTPSPPPLQPNQPIQRKRGAPPRPPLPLPLFPLAQPRTLEVRRGTVRQTVPGPAGSRTRPPPLPSRRIPPQRLGVSPGTSSPLRSPQTSSLLRGLGPRRLRLLLNRPRPRIVSPRPRLQVRRPAKLRTLNLQSSPSIAMTRPQKTAPSHKDNRTAFQRRRSRWEEVGKRQKKSRKEKNSLHRRPNSGEGKKKQFCPDPRKMLFLEIPIII